MTEIDFTHEQGQTLGPCPQCGEPLAVGEKTQRRKPKGDWAEGVKSGETATVRWLTWECSADATHETYPPPKPTMEPA